MTEQPSRRALAIARGLIRTGRAFGAEADGGYLRVRALAGGFYWIALDGARLLRGETREYADELQLGFVSVMARAGAET